MMKILITNDDGISSRGLLLLAKKAMKFGEVTVAAPKTEQSGKSQSINIHSPFEAREVELLPGVLEQKQELFRLMADGAK